MTIHKVKDEFVLKASIGELLAALSGINCAGVTVVKNGADTKKDPIASIGYEAAKMTYSMRNELGSRSMDPDMAAFRITEFLSSAREVLVAHENTVLSLPTGTLGGTLKDVVLHIDEILKREAIGGDRPAVKFYNGNLQGKFHAAYMSKSSGEDPDEEALDDKDTAPAPEAKAAPRRGRRKTKPGPGAVPL
jgi:hypothetical protein